MPSRCLYVVLLTALADIETVAAQVKPSASHPTSESTCPASIQVHQTPVGETAPGWQALGSDRNHPLTNVSFFAGAPNERMQLAPDSEQRKGKTLTSTWQLIPHDRVYWVACEYGRTAATNSKPLDNGVTSCVAEHDLNSSPPVLKRWSCRSDQMR
jgi:hypothetical protein